MSVCKAQFDLFFLFIVKFFYSSVQLLNYGPVCFFWVVAVYDSQEFIASDSEGLAVFSDCGLKYVRGILNVSVAFFMSERIVYLLEVIDIMTKEYSSSVFSRPFMSFPVNSASFSM